MKVNKIPIRPNKIGIDLILCPKTNLYLQDLYCRRCSYYKIDNENFVECTFTGHRYGKPDPIKDRIIKNLSNSFITELPIKNNPNIENRMKNFTERLQNSKSMNVQNELKKDLSHYMKKTNLSTRLEKIKKVTLKSEE
ncbi:MAG: hypothetical protein KAW66_03985 [Candidatus Lokiarchaeota archaeon]|nr:hypothetical protein [Candidatus Lokiarchaeota archaeon]